MSTPPRPIHAPLTQMALHNVCPAGVPDVFRRHYGKWRAGAMAIGGDQTAHLLWRLRNGEVSQHNKVGVGQTASALPD